MGMDFKQIKYIFTGDTSSLSSSTAKAISELDKLGKKVKDTVKNSSSLNKMGSEVNKVVKKLSSLGSATSKANKQMNNLGKNVNFNAARKQIDSLVSSIGSKFSKVSQAATPLISKMQSIKASAEKAFSRMKTKLDSVSAAFRRVSKSADSDSNSQSKLNKLVQIGTNLKNNLKSTTDKLNSSFSKLGNNTKSVSVSFKDMITNGQGVRSLFQTLTGMQLGTVFAEGLKSALHYTEVLNMFNTVLGDSVEAGEEFVSQMQEVYGIDPTTIMEATSMFYQLASAVETPTDAARQMSLGLTTVATDIASLFDVDFTKVSEDLASGMQGMTRSVRKYGIDIRMATLETTAASLGMQVNADTTSEANRQALRYITIVRQARAASGDFAKTIESPANQLRILKEQFQQLARAIGNLFLPVLQKILPYLNGIVMAIRSIVQFFGKLLGVKDIEFGGATDSAKALGGSVSDAGDSIDSATQKAKKLKKELTTGIDELNILKEDESDSDTGSTGGGGGGVSGGDVLDPTLAAALSELEVEMESVRMKANDVRDAILEFLGFSWDKNGQLTFDASQLETNLINKFPSWTETIRSTFTNWQGIADGLKAVWDALSQTLGSVFQGIVDGFTNMINVFNLDEMTAGFIDTLPEKLQTIADWINDNQEMFKTFGQYISYIGTGFAAWKVVSQLAGVFAPLIKLIMGMNPLLLVLVAAVVGIAAGFKRSYEQSESFREGVVDLKADGIDAIQSIITMLQTLWEEFEPIIQNIWDFLVDLWDDCLSDLFLNIAEAIVEVVDAIADIVTFLVDTFGPSLSSAIDAILLIASPIFSTIGTFISELVEAIGGIATFISGVFEGDWKKAWEGIKKVFASVLNLIIAAAESMMNFVIAGMNTFLKAILTGVQKLVNGILDGIEWVADKIGLDINLPTWETIPQIPKVSLSRINVTEGTGGGKKKMATGGVVTRPTDALIGEGRYPEAVIPLGNSPQLAEMLKQFADIVEAQKQDDTVPINVVMNLDGEVIYKNQQRVSRRRGVSFEMGEFMR